MQEIRIGTRGSRLALWQASFVAERLRALGMESETTVYSTRGDRDLDTPLPEMGDKALFTAELDSALIEGEVDIAVHSLKDLPTDLGEGLRLAAVPVRAEPWDVLVARDPEVRDLGQLPERPTVATSSLRRAAQLLRWRPGVNVVPVRGNVPTRVRKLRDGDWDGIILAEAGLRRLGMESDISARIQPTEMLPAVSQGALAVVTSASTRLSANIIRELDAPDIHACVLAERAFLRRLEGGCQAPIAALCQISTSGHLELEGAVLSLDGSEAVRGTDHGATEDAERMGARLAERLLREGASSILAAVRASSE